MVVDADHPNKTIQDKLEAIYALHTKKMDFRLDAGPYRDLLEKLGNPQDSLPPVIHLAGTNGKGSTLAFLKSIYEAAGLKVHAYTSPHLIKFNERITLAGHHIDDVTLSRYLDMIEEANAGAPITFFEYTTALALKAMADTPADICLLETGLGGRLDCTNVIEKPLATVITSIGHDHMDWLGDTIEKITHEKARIMKAGVPCIIAPQQYNQTHKVFESRAIELGCDVHIVERLDNLPPLGLVGDHQKDNASTAVKTISVIAPDISPDIINQALKTTKWPARMEKLSDAPEIWFDCGHNAEGASVIADQLKQWKDDQPNRPIHLILGLAADKNGDEFMKPLWGFIESVTCVDLLNARNAQTGEVLSGKVTQAQKPVLTTPTIEEALTSITNKNALILITGSLYLYEQIK